MYPTLAFDKAAHLKLSPKAIIYNMMSRWQEAIYPHLKAPEIINALKIGFEDHFSSPEEIEEYPWDNPRLDAFGSMGFADLHQIMDPINFKAYIGNEEESYYASIKKQNESIENEDEDEDYCDWIKDGSYFAYRASSRCHHLAPFCYELGRKIYPELKWNIFKTPAHSNAIGIENGEIMVIMDLLWGENENDPQDLIKKMYTHSVNIMKFQFKDKFSIEELSIIEKALHDMSAELLNT